jgi:hypothetical protein
MSLCDSALSPTVKEVQGIIDACECHVVINPPGFLLLKFCLFISSFRDSDCSWKVRTKSLSFFFA